MEASLEDAQLLRMVFHGRFKLRSSQISQILVVILIPHLGARLGLFAGRIRKEIVQLAAVGALLLRIEVKLQNLADKVWAFGSAWS